MAKKKSNKSSRSSSSALAGARDQSAAPAAAAGAPPGDGARVPPKFDNPLEERLYQIDPSFVGARSNRFASAIARGRAAVPELLAALKTDDALARLDAVEALGELRDHAALEPLRSLINDKDPDVRTATAVALVRIGDDQLFPEMVKALRSDNASVVVGAALVLGHLADRSAVPNLVEAFKTDDLRIGSAVAWALGRCGDPVALPWLTTAVRLNFVAANACEALGRIGDAKATPVLLKALESPNDDTRAYAARALGILKHGSAKGGLGSMMGTLAANQVVPALKKLLGDRARKVRLCAALAMYELGEQKAAGRQIVQELTA
ncbi:MAG: HEAT repeat domain-containing protein [Pseudomonadota bacterium]